MSGASDFVVDGVLRVPASLMANRDDAQFVQRVLEEGAGCEVAFLHMCTGFHDPLAFRKLCAFLKTPPLWAANLGELSFDPEQLEELLATVQASEVTHMFYECDALPDGVKTALRDAIRANRAKHTRWHLTGGAHDTIVHQCTNMWFDPIRHKVNRSPL